ncbi:hypothetical protein ALC62_01129 [Cyphomyrmex costatus]|uniref:Uncharacterized protein n=1 Tax=Cyphomyrmex costatus TaxID=456900 RepID=A0A195D4Z9_9HYME|nr:hypothetical protein ALC62_01129 [Cyphomyrmex costatus]
MMELLSGLCDNRGIHFSRASHHRDVEFSAAAFRDLSLGYEKRTRGNGKVHHGGLGRYVVGLVVKRKKIPTCDVYGLVYRRDISSRRLSEKKVASCPFSNRVGTNNTARYASFLFRHRRNPSPSPLFLIL